MDGLIKGLVNVAIDHIQGGDDGDDRRGRDDQRTDNRSRSTWAEVASGNAENHDGAFNPNTNYSTRPEHQHSSHKGRYGNDEWESEESRRRPQTIQQAEDKNDDGWETVGKKTSRHKVPKDQWSNYKCSPDEQHYSNDAEYGTKIEPSEEELSDLAVAANKLWDLDLNRLVSGKDYEIDCGEGKKVYQKDDMAEGCLFSWLAEEIFTRRPTYSRFCALLDNYNPHEGYREKVTAEEISEQKAFIEEISRTAPIKYLYKYLVAKRVISGSYQDFKEMMSRLWFDLYNRGGTSGSSSAFEHVFVGEIKRGEQEVSGFHNWIQFYLEEAKGRVDYQGYIFPRRRGQTPDSETQLLTIQFEWNGVLKSVSSTLVGVSPEFEIALYTLCFYLGGEDNRVELGPYQVNIKCYRHGDRLGSAFPIADC